MNKEMAYLLGMITGNCRIERGDTETTIFIDIPHKKLETEFQDDVGIYVKASFTDIRQVLEPLISTEMTFSQRAKVSLITFKKPNGDYLMREILRYVGDATSSHNIRISPEIYSFSDIERKYFIKGFADVTGYIRRSNYFFDKAAHRVYFEIPHNWELVVDFCNMLKSVDIPVQNIDWAHPNMRDGNLAKYSQGNRDFWKKEHQVKVWAIEYEPIGFAVIHKQEALSVFANEHRSWLKEQGKNPESNTHRYYWESNGKAKVKPHHPGETDVFIPAKIRGMHFDSWKDIAEKLGYNQQS